MYAINSSKNKTSNDMQFCVSALFHQPDNMILLDDNHSGEVSSARGVEGRPVGLIALKVGSSNLPPATIYIH